VSNCYNASTMIMPIWVQVEVQSLLYRHIKQQCSTTFFFFFFSFNKKLGLCFFVPSFLVINCRMPSH
jgi:hypothetical protein